MRLFLFILIGLLGQTVFGQAKNISIPLWRGTDTSLWYKRLQNDLPKLGLQNLLTNTDSIHFRFWTEIQSVDIWSKDGKIFYGSFTNYTTSYNEDKWKDNKPKPDNFYKSSSPLDTHTARVIFNKFQNLNVFSIPNQDSIKGWGTGLDGYDYSIEFSSPKTYSFKSYWSPGFYADKLKEAKIIDSVGSFLATTLKMRESFNTFLFSLPQGSYRGGGISIISTPKKRRRRLH